MNSIDRLRLVVGWMIAGAWLGSMVLDAVVPSYDVPASIHGLMLLVAGAFFGPTIYNRGKERNGNGNGHRSNSE